MNDDTWNVGNNLLFDLLKEGFKHAQSWDDVQIAMAVKAADHVRDWYPPREYPACSSTAANYIRGRKGNQDYSEIDSRAMGEWLFVMTRIRGENKTSLEMITHAISKLEPHPSFSGKCERLRGWVKAHSENTIKDIYFDALKVMTRDQIEKHRNKETYSKNGKVYKTKEYGA